MIQDRLVEVLADRGSDAFPRWVVGSGFLIDGRRVLTSGHVAAEGVLLVRRVGDIGGPKTEWNATLRLLGDLATADLALIELDEEVGAFPMIGFVKISRRTQQLTAVENCHAVGFPDFMRNGDDRSSARDTAHVSGHIPIAQYLVAGLLTLQVTHTPEALPPSRKLLRESQWSGMSGAAVLVEDRIVGVVSEHAARQGDSALTVVPITLIDTLPNAASWWAEVGVGPDEFLTLPRARSILARWSNSVAEWWSSLSVKRRAFVLMAALSVLTLAGVLAMPLVQPYFGTSEEPPSGSAPKSAEKIENLGLTVAISDKSYRAILPLLNSQTKEQRLDKVELIITFKGPPCAEIPNILVYEVKPSIIVDSSGQIERGSVSVESGLAKGFTNPATGAYNWGCGMNQLQLHFRPAGAVLARESTTSVLVDIPRKLPVSKMINGVPGFETSQAELPKIGDSMANFIAFHAIAVTDSAFRINSCFLLAANDFQPQTGPQDCDTKIEDNEVFWRQKWGPNRSWLKYERAH